MIELLSLLSFNQANLYRLTRSYVIEYKAKYVCSKRKVINYNGIIYYIRTCDKNREEVVNRCTWLANEVGRLYVYEDANKWCSKEKKLYKSAWMYS